MRRPAWQACKVPSETSSLIPLCHPIRIDRVAATCRSCADRIEITAVTEIVERTGVEMEALTACAGAGLTLACSLLELDPEVAIEAHSVAQIGRPVRRMAEGCSGSPAGPVPTSPRSPPVQRDR